MPVTWKINGTEISLLPVGRLTLDLVNQQPDALRFEKSDVEFDLATAYTSAPSVAITGGNGSGATGTAAVSGGVVSSLTLTAAGSGYTAPPNVAIVGGGGFGATAVARLTGTSLSGIYLNDTGSGYTSAPTVIISGGGGSGAAATAVLATRAVASVAITAGGSGFTSTPTVTFSGGGGSGAAGTAVLSGGSVVSLSLTAGGSGYTSAPTVTFTGGGGTGAAATAVLASRAVASAALSAAGSGFLTPPAVTLAGGGGTGAAITAALTPTTLAGISVTNPGSGYTSAPEVTLSGGGGSGATAVAVLSGGSVASITLTNAGSGYTGNTRVTFSGGGGSGAIAYCVLTATGVSAAYPESRALHAWAGTPTVSFTGGGGSGAAATATVDGIVYGVSITNFGSGYTSRPTVSLVGGGGSGAEVWAEVANGLVVRLTLLRHGTGYTSTPTVVISGGGGSGAAALAYQSQSIVGVTITNAGTGYTYAPSVRFTYGSRIERGGATLVPTTIASIAMQAGGFGYTSAPTVAVESWATYGRALLFPKVVAGEVTEIVRRDVNETGELLPLGGADYTSVPTITVSSETGSGATATATISGGAITAITVDTAGSGYLYPTNVSAGVTVPNSGTGATATSAIGVVVAAIAVTDPGSGYTSAPTVGFTGGGGSGATATAILTPTSLASLTVSAGGSGYTSAPTITIAEGTGSGATPASATATLAAAAVASLALTSGGDNYTSAPTLGFTGGGGSGASATAAISVAVASITVTNAGSGYTSAPTVGFSGGGGSGATATAALTTAGLASFTLTNAGSGYTSVPGISLSGGGGSGAEPYAELTATTVASLVLTNNGGVLAFDTAITLTREEAGIEEIWFVGAIRETPRTRSSRDNAIRYVALGPWQWLERIPFLQTFQKASDPENPASTLEDYQRGRVVIAQDGGGLKVTLGEFLNLVLDYAISAKPGVMQRADFSGLDLTIPWDEAIDLSCAEVISRVLQFLPDSVCWWDYSYSPPKLNITRRADLTALELPVQPSGAADDAEAYAPLESIDLRERADLRKTGVYLLYLATNRANQVSWETATPDVYPVGTVASDPDTLFRTVQLAGGVAQSTVLTQRVDVDPIPSDLFYDSATWLASGSQFDALRTWWFKHAPELNSSYITIKGFASCTRIGDSMGFDGQLNNELVAGAITDWMESRQNITSEDQTVTAFIHFEEARPNDSTKKARHVKKFVAVIKATNANTKTYAFTAETSYTPPEEVPTGLARAIYDAISVPHFDGSVSLVESEASYRLLVGRALNLTGSLAAWETMAAIVQRARIDLERGTTQLQVGPPRQLGPDDLAELYRVNRNRQPVTSYLTRSTGVSGSLSGGGEQGLGRHHRGGARASGVAQAPARYTYALSVAGTTPTNTEISTALAAAYSSNNIPVEGDVVSLTVSGTVKFTVIISLTAISAEGWRRVAFTFGSVTYYGWVQQVGLY